MSASALLASTIITTLGLAGLAFVASRKGYQVLAALLAERSSESVALALAALNPALRPRD
jgi:hypothetical protein